VKQELYDYLIAHAGIGTAVGDRIWQDVAKPGETKPFIVFTRVSENHDHTMAGPSSMAFQRIQIDCYATTAAARETVSEAVRNALDGYSGTLGTVNVREIWLDSQRDSYDEPISGNAAPLYRTGMDFMIAHVQSVPTL
jgi:hypothetical protein